MTSFERQYRATANTIKYWSRAKYWNLWDAGYLIAGLDPEAAQSRSVRHDTNPNSDPSYRISILLKQELDAASFQDRFRPGKIFTVADLLEIEVPEELRAAVKRYDERRAALENAGESQEQLESAQDRPKSETGISTRRANTYLKIIAAIAYEEHGWRPGIRGPAAGEIASATERIGSPVTGDTVRDVLKEAAEFVEPESE